MVRITRLAWVFGAAVSCSVAGFGCGTASAAPVLTTLVAFGGNGSVSVAGLTFDLAGNLYGTTLFGGSGSNEFGNGTVFELSGPAHTKFTSLVSFKGANGTGPTAALTLDDFGNLYGTTQSGGTDNMGTVFELSGAQHRTLTTLVSFTGADGTGPLGGLALYAPRQFHIPGHPYYAGYLFGTTSTGGANGDGTVFKLSGAAHDHTATLLSFTAGVNGARPGSTLVADSAGHLFGTTFTGGPGTYGTVFELSGFDHRTLTTLAAFSGPNGANPIGGLTLDAAGNLYGTTQYGGPGYGGTIFELAGPGHRKLVTIASFGSNDPAGAVPQGTLLIDAAGDLFGTTNGGADEFGGAFLGAVFKLSADHQTLTPLYAFTGNADGDIPQAGLTADAAGNLYGTTTSGGTGGGTVFKLSGAGFVTSLAPPPSSKP